MEPPNPREATEAPAPPVPSVPDWVADSKILQEARLFVGSFRRAVNHPARFSADWATSAVTEMNPLTFFTISLGLRTSFRALLRWSGWEGVGALGENTPDLLKSQLGPYLLPVLLALFIHFAALRRTGRGWKATLGAVLFAEGSWGALLRVLQLPLIAAEARAGHGVQVAGSMLAILLDSACLAPFLAGAHGRSAWRTLAWCLSFYLALLVVGAAVVAALRLNLA